MECMNTCGKDLTGRQKQFCSDKCRMAFKRNPNTKVEQKIDLSVGAIWLGTLI